MAWFPRRSVERNASEDQGIMSEVFQHAIRYGWLNDGDNPIFAVRQSTKRERVTEPLEAAEFRALMLKLPPMDARHRHR